MPDNDPTSETSAPRIKVWDLPTRLFHWLLAILVLLQYGTAEWHWLDMDWHFRFGYATLALLLFRIAWGVAGSRTSRFADFVRGPRRVVHYVENSLAQRETRSLGHNPLGGWMVMAFLLCLLVQVGTGLFAGDGIAVFGPLNARVSLDTTDWLTAIHTINQNLLLALIVLHVVAVLAHWVVKRDNLVAPMWHGFKRADAPAPRLASGWLALALLAGAALVVWAIVAWGSSASG